MTYQLPEKRVYFFSAERTEGHAGLKNILGGKGANLAEMTSLKLPVPPGFTISTEICKAFYDNEEKLPKEVCEDVLEALTSIEETLGKKFGDPENPLLVSVRSGARVSMPGMMDTILNLGLNDATVKGLAKVSENPRFAWDSYRRFLQMYANVVMGMNHSLLDVIMEDLKVDKNYQLDTELTEEDLQKLVENFKKEIITSTGSPFPSDPKDQLWGAIEAVFKSWNIPRAITYRELHGYSSSWGTAVNIQSMVFGNMGNDSATGVAFTRDPSTGERVFYGEYLLNAQGEDVVAGIRTPQPISKPNSSKSRKLSSLNADTSVSAANSNLNEGGDPKSGDSKSGTGNGLSHLSLEESMPKSYSQLEEVYKKLELHYRDMQDIEFTVERGHLWMLQTRSGKRTASAALRIACEMVDEGLITEKEAVMRVEPQSLDQLLHPRLDPDTQKTVLAQGLPASPGGAVGQVVFSPEDAVAWVEAGKKVILVRVETSPEDIEGMVNAQGILTSRGGMTSHAAVVARGMGKCCVAGCDSVEVDYAKKQFVANGYVIQEGDFITLDGSVGEVYLGEVPTIDPVLDGYFERIMEMADSFRRMEVRTNADTPKDAEVARQFGAQGIGLTRTEHMFFGADRIDVVRAMIMADSTRDREEALEKLLPMQREDFRGIFEAMSGLPVTVRLLDPPLHEFLPHTDKEVKDIAKRLGWGEENLKAKVRNLHEFNPMLGHRGCRLAITYPEIYRMQAQAIAEAACDALDAGKEVSPEIMIPLVGMAGELKVLRELVKSTVEKIQAERCRKFSYLIGTMIELPRAAITADEIAHHADFFSFGTNDLTQTCIGISRDDAARFLETYVEEGIFSKDPFTSLDQQGVGKLVQMGVDLGRETKPDIKLGICGEHGGDPESIHFFNKVGLNYVSCSPYRVPIARLSAAQASLECDK